MYFINPHTVWISNSVQAPFFTIFLALSNIWPLVDSQACCGNAAANQVSRTKRKLMLPPAGPDHQPAGQAASSWDEAPDGDDLAAKRGEVCERTSADSAGRNTGAIGWNKDLLVWTFKLRRSWTRTFTSAFTPRVSLPNKIQGKTGRRFHHTGKKGRVHNWYATPFPLRTI